MQCRDDSLLFITLTVSFIFEADRNISSKRAALNTELSSETALLAGGRLCWMHVIVLDTRSFFFLINEKDLRTERICDLFIHVR